MLPSSLFSLVSVAILQYQFCVVLANPYEKPIK
jgi:hypothetical protein